jgi:hypothetical protein
MSWPYWMMLCLLNIAVISFLFGNYYMNAKNSNEGDYLPKGLLKYNDHERLDHYLINNKTYEHLTVTMIDTYYGYVSAYYDNRSYAVIVLGKVYLTWLNASYYVPRPSMCDFYSKSGAFSHAVPLHFFTSYLFYCNLSRNATNIPHAVSLRLLNDSEALYRPVIIRVPPLGLPMQKGTNLSS